MNDVELAKMLFGDNRTNASYATSTNASIIPGRTRTYSALALEDSHGGSVRVQVDGTVIGSSDGSVVLPTQAIVHAGDIVNVTVINGSPVVTGAAGWGDQVGDTIVAANAMIDNLEANKATVFALNAEIARIDELYTDYAHINDLVADKADITDLTAATARIDTLESTSATIEQLNVEKLRIDNLVATKADVEDLTAANAEIDRLSTSVAKIDEMSADTAKIHNLTADQLSAAVAYIESLSADDITAESLSADVAKIHNLTVDELAAASAYISDLLADNVTASSIIADHGEFETVKANAAKVANLTAQQLEADHATIESLDVNYAQVNLANVNNAWIQNGVVKDGAITNAMINDVSANKLTAGTIDAANITVTNLNASNITTGTLNGQRIGDGSLSLSKLDESVYTEGEVDTIVNGLNDRIDGAIETFTGTTVPTLNNTPASAWNTTKLRDQHVGDVYYVVNADSNQNGYCYRFTKSGSSYSWQLIKDSDVTAALSRLTTAEGKITTFDTDISTLKTDTGTLTTRTTTLETQMADAESQISTKVDTTTFNELKSDVDEQSSQITTLTTITTNNGLTTTTNITNTVNTVSQTAEGNASKIEDLETVNTSNGITSTTNISRRISSFEQDVDGFKKSISETYATVDDVQSITNRLDAAESNIVQNATSISAAVTKSEIYELDEETGEPTSTKLWDSAIDASAKRIVLNLESTYVTNDDLVKLEERFGSRLALSSSDLLLEISNKYATKESVDTYFRAYGDGLLICKKGQSVGSFLSANGAFDVVSITWNEDTPEIGEYPLTHVTGDTTTFGASNSAHVAIETVQDDEGNQTRRIGFYDGGELVAFMMGGLFYVENSMTLKSIRIGEDNPQTEEQEGWAWEYEDNTNVSFKWVGGGV